RHQLDRGDAELAERREVWNRAVEGPLVREGADVQLVDHEFLEREPEAVHPRGFDDLRPAEQAVRLAARARVGELAAPVEDVGVALARCCAERRGPEPAALRRQRAAAAVEPDLDAA